MVESEVGLQLQRSQSHGELKSYLYSRICMANKPVTLKIAFFLVSLTPLRHESSKTLLEGHDTVNKLVRAAARDKTEICKK